MVEGAKVITSGDQGPTYFRDQAQNRSPSQCAGLPPLGAQSLLKYLVFRPSRPKGEMVLVSGCLDPFPILLVGLATFWPYLVAMGLLYPRGHTIVVTVRPGQDGCA